MQILLARLVRRRPALRVKIQKNAFATQFTTPYRSSADCWADFWQNADVWQNTDLESNDYETMFSQLSDATHSATLQHTATHCNTLQHTATHCDSLQHNKVVLMGATINAGKFFYVLKSQRSSSSMY